jgi:pectinesterase
VIIYGATSDANSYTSNTVTVSRNEPASVAGSNDKSGTVRVEAAGVSCQCAVAVLARFSDV